MERKIVLEIEELEERIAPHCALGFADWGGAAVVKYHAGDGYLWMGGSFPGQGEGLGRVYLPTPETDNAMGQWDQNGEDPGCDAVPPGQQDG